VAQHASDQIICVCNEKSAYLCSHNVRVFPAPSHGKQDVSVSLCFGLSQIFLNFSLPIPSSDGIPGRRRSVPMYSWPPQRAYFDGAYSKSHLNIFIGLSMRRSSCRDHNVLPAHKPIPNV